VVSQVLHEHAAPLSAAGPTIRSRRLIKCAKDSGQHPLSRHAQLLPKGTDPMPLRRSPNAAAHTRPKPGRNRPEQVVAINRNAWSQSIGTGGRNQPVRAGIDLADLLGSLWSREVARKGPACLSADGRVAPYLRGPPQDFAPSCFHVASTGGIGDWVYKRRRPLTIWVSGRIWLRGPDLNRRPSGYEWLQSGCAGLRRNSFYYAFSMV